MLLPIVAGLLLWDRLPDRIATHFGPGNQPDGWSGKPFAVFGLPLIMLAVHGLTILPLLLDPKVKNLPSAVINLCLWIIPLCSLLVSALCYLMALGRAVDVGFFVALFFGILLVAIGNYLPKCRLNNTVGIRVPWTLADEDNWAFTHRLGGWVWTAGGLLVILFAFLGRTTLFMPVIALVCIVPVAASYFYWRRNSGKEKRKFPNGRDGC